METAPIPALCSRASFVLLPVCYLRTKNALVIKFLVALIRVGDKSNVRIFEQMQFWLDAILFWIMPLWVIRFSFRLAVRPYVGLNLQKKPSESSSIHPGPGSQVTMVFPQSHLKQFPFFQVCTFQETHPKEEPDVSLVHFHDELAGETGGNEDCDAMKI